jgi:hypothetical protein
MKQADLSSQCDGSNTSFELPEEYQAGSLRVYYNGVRQVEGETFSEHNSTTFTTETFSEHNSTTFTTTDFTPETGDFLTVDYIASS